LSKYVKKIKVPKTKAQLDAQAAKVAKANLARKNALYRASQDIGKIPKCKNPKRRKKAEKSYKFFCETYFPRIFCLPWSKDLLRVIGKTELVVIDGETMAVAMPRGSGKTRLCEAAVLWASLSARHPYCKYIGSVNPEAIKAIGGIKVALFTNDLLLEDFPEVCYPIRKLNGQSRKCKGQTHNGEHTNIVWAKDRITLPTIKGSKLSGFTIDAASLEGHVRGAWINMPDGSVARPSLAVCDDPQTRESARSQGPQGQTTFRLAVINEDVRGLAGPQRQTAILVPCTVICQGDLADQLLNRTLNPEYRGERTKRLYHWPENKGPWEEYRELRDGLLRGDQPVGEAIKFYRLRMATCGRRMDDPPDGCKECPRRETCMDCGAQVDWADRLDDKRNLSAVQAAMHSFYKYKAEGFASEFQNEPLSSEGADLILTATACAAKFNGRTWAEVPIECTEITMGIDVQMSSLWYVIIAWKPNATGYVVDYGVWPRQVRRVFTLADIVDSHASLQAKYPGRGTEGAIQAGLQDLVQSSLDRNFVRAGGAGLAKISRVFVDSGKWPGAIANVKHLISGNAMMLCKGIGIKAGTKPMSSYKRKVGEQHGDHWYMPNTRGTREFPYVGIDVNHWKSFVHGGFLTPTGDPGAFTLYGDNAGLHGLFASHITAETFTTTHGHGRDVQEWTIRPQRPDNHWLDAAVYACAAASMLGICAPNKAKPGGQRQALPPPMSLAELAKGAKR